MPGPSVDKIVRFGDTLERKRPADSYRQRAIAGGGGQVCGGLFLGLAPDALLDRVRHLANGVDDASCVAMPDDSWVGH